MYKREGERQREYFWKKFICMIMINYQVTLNISRETISSLHEFTA